MMPTMIKASKPSRAEASDVAGAVIDGADGILLQEETSVGDYPFQAVTQLSKIYAESEKTLNYKKMYNDINMYTPTNISNAEITAQAACQSVFDYKDIALIACITETGKLAKLVSKYKPQVTVIACTNEMVVK